MVARVEMIALAQLTLDDNIQARQELSVGAIGEYRMLYDEDHDLGHLTVYHDGKGYRLADGFQRVHAARQARKTHLPAQIQSGTKRDAMLYACQANKHGKPLNNADKRRISDRLLKDEEWGQWSDRKIALHCGVSHEFVRQRRALLSTPDSDPKQVRTYVNRWGHTATMHTGNIGHQSPPTQDTFAPYFDAMESPPTQHQLDTLKALGDQEPPPKSRMEADDRIHAIIRKQAQQVHSPVDGLDAVVTEGLSALKLAWRKASPAARSTFRRWINDQPPEEAGAVIHSAKTRQFAEEIARICDPDAASVGQKDTP